MMREYTVEVERAYRVTVKVTGGSREQAVSSARRLTERGRMDLSAVRTHIVDTNNVSK